MVRVLLTNDDGVEAPGLWALYQECTRQGIEATVVAPARERSATGHAITIFNEITLREHVRGHKDSAYAIDGTPADCVKMALSVIMNEAPPDVVISGINRGQNTGTSILYSGTVAAALEATLNGFKAIAVSLAVTSPKTAGECEGDPKELPTGTLEEVARVPANYGFAARFSVRLAKIVAERGLPPGVLLNVNIPNVPEQEIRGIVVSKMGHSVFVDEFKAVNEKAGLIAYRNVGNRLIHSSEGEDWDDLVLRQNKISITPLHYDLTHHHFLEELKRWVEAEEIESRIIGEQVAEELSKGLDAEIVG